MDSNNMLKLCRLCLVKDDVNIPIFEEQGDIRQIFLKISSCLPVKVSRDDQLPKKICDGCSYKLDMLHEFWNTSANAEKQLLTWLGEAGMSSQMADGTISAVAQQIKPADAFVKQETIDPPDIHMDDDDDDDEEDKDYMKQEEENSNNVEEPPPKRARRTAAVKAAIALDQNSDDDDDSGEPMTKVEDDSEDSDNEDHEPAFVDVPSTSADDQPGPSGVGKDGVEAPDEEITENIYIVISGNKTARSKEQPPYCNVCEKDFKTSIKYAKHSIKHSLDGIFSCHICHITAKMTLDQIETHIRIHENKPKYICMYCQAKLFSKYSAIKHEICHSGIKGSSTVFCEICSKGFMFLCSLQAHLKESHPNCGVKIDKKLNQRYTLPEEHLPVPIFPSSSIFCYICKNTYKDNIHYALHTVKHNKNGQFNCYLCALQCKMSDSDVVDHIKMHLTATAHRCSVCDKGFSRKIDAVEHVYYHKSHKPYECKLCNTNFMFSRCLLSHRKNHHNLTNKWVRGCTSCDFHQL